MPPPRPYPAWVLGGILGAILLVSVGAIAYRAVTSVAHAAITPEPSVSVPIPGSLPVDAPVAAEPNALPAAAEQRVHAGDSIPFAEPVPVPVAPALDAPERAAPVDSARAAVARPPPTPAELQAALSATPIIMYSTTWCGVCRRARQFLAENGLQYREIDADTTPDGWAKVEQLTGHRGVPVIVVDGEVTASGLSPQRVMSAVAHSMERRLGVTGIRFTSK